MRGATTDIARLCNISLISTHAPHARCNNQQWADGKNFSISTHAPHARCNLRLRNSVRHQPISTHAPHARCNFHFRPNNIKPDDFYSRTSCEVQRTHSSAQPQHCNFYSRTSCEVQRQEEHTTTKTAAFLLTHLMRGATRYARWLVK